MRTASILKRLTHLVRKMRDWFAKLFMPCTRKTKLSGVRVELTDKGWIIGGILYEDYFAIAIAPVECQLILARAIRKRAQRQKNSAAKRHILQEAKAIEKSAKADAECEMKWRARG